MVTTSVVSAFRVLEAVAETQPVGLSQLARDVGLPKSSVQRVLLTLQELGWLRPTESAPIRWQLTHRMRAVAYRGGLDGSLREAASTVMRGLRATTGETAQLTVPDGESLVLVDQVDTVQRLRVSMSVGERLSLHGSAAGLAYLSSCTSDFVETQLSGGLQNSATADRARIRNSLNEIRECGYSVGAEPAMDGTCVVAAAITHFADPVAVVSICAPSSRVDAVRIAEIGSLVCDAASAISRRL